MKQILSLFRGLKEAIKVAKLCSEKFPSHCESGNEIAFFILKNNCPLCIDKPIIEGISELEYSMKYPAKNVLTLGRIKIYLCDEHFRKLRDEMNKTDI